MNEPKRPRGRPRLAQENVSVPRSIRLTPAEWEKFDQLGTGWLKAALKRAKIEQPSGTDEVKQPA